MGVYGMWGHRGKGVSGYGMCRHMGDIGVLVRGI